LEFLLGQNFICIAILYGWYRFPTKTWPWPYMTTSPCHLASLFVAILWQLFGNAERKRCSIKPFLNRPIIFFSIARNGKFRFLEGLTNTNWKKELSRQATGESCEAADWRELGWGKDHLFFYFIGIKTSKILKLSPIIDFKVNAEGGIWLQEEIFHAAAVGCTWSMARWK
jgi:hypothetical protein